MTARNLLALKWLVICLGAALFCELVFVTGVLIAHREEIGALLKATAKP